jgi:CHAD domain-containing protein
MIDTEQAAPAQPKPLPNRARARTLSNIIQSQLESLQTYHRAVLESDDVEAIHKTRVTTRKLQASLDLLEWKDAELNVRPIKRQLRRWRRMLSRARNYDVFLTLVDKEATGQRAAAREQFELLRGILQKRRARRAAAVRKYHKRVKVSQMAAKLGLNLSQPPQDETNGAEDAGSAPLQQASEAALIAEPDGGQPGEWEEEKIIIRAADRLEQRLSEFHALVAQSHPTTDPADLHELRIAAKRLRYLLEVVTEMGYGEAARALTWLRTLQDKIGDWHDLQSLEEEIVGIVSRRKFVREHLAESSRMLQAAAHLKKKKESLAGKLFPINPPRILTSTTRRLVRDLRKKAGLPVRAARPKKSKTVEQQEIRPA